MSFFLIAKWYYLKQCVVGLNSGFRYQEVTVLNQNLNCVSIISICQSVFYIFFQWQENTTPIFKFSIIPSLPFMSSNCNFAWSFRSSQPPFQHFLMGFFVPWIFRSFMFFFHNPFNSINLFIISYCHLWN